MTTSRIPLILGLPFCILLLLSGRLAALQIFKHEQYKVKAGTQHLRKRKLHGYRGDIFSRGDAVLARSMPVQSLFCDVPNVKDDVRFALEVGRALDWDHNQRLDLLQRLATTKRKFFWIKRSLTRVEAKALAGLGLRGVGLRKEYRRMHPHGNLAAHVLGFIRPDGKPLAGTELSLNEILRGVDGFRHCTVDGAGQVYMSGEEIEVHPIPGQAIHLTIDRDIQSAAETALNKVVERDAPDGASLIVMDPKNGAILALANRPTFSPGKYGSAPAASRRNRAITDMLPPGSTWKPLVAARAMDLGLVQPDDVFRCGPGRWRYRRRLIHDHKPVGTVTFPYVLIKSSNIGMAQIGIKMGGERLRTLLLDLGVHTPTGVRLPGEVRGSMASAKSWTYYSTTSIPMGRELLTTPLQLAAAWCALANGGTWWPPRIVEAVHDRPTRNIRATLGRKNPLPRTRPPRTIYSPQTCRTISDILVRVVEEGTGKRARIKGLRVAGKTGTAKKSRRESEYVASFCAYAPAEDPQLVVVCVVDNPTKGRHYGGSVAAPAVRDVINSWWRRTRSFSNRSTR